MTTGSIILASYKGTRRENPKARAFDRLVCTWPPSRGRFSHSEMAFTPVSGTTYSCWSSSLRDGGVRPKDIDLASGSWSLVVLPDYPVEPALAWFQLHRGQRYDWPGVLGYVVPSVDQVERWKYCSESFALALRASALAVHSRRLPYPSSHIAPSPLHAWALAQPGARSYELHRPAAGPFLNQPQTQHHGATHV